MSVEDLTLIEAAIIHGWSKGMKNHNVAGALGLPYGTARRHMTSIFDKLGVRTKWGAVGMWVRWSAC